MDLVLKKKESPNGSDWTLPAVTLNTYTAPRAYSPDNYPAGCTPGPGCGRIHYGSPVFIDAAASGPQRLGWVVAYPAARSDIPSITNLNVCAQNLAGCFTITWSTDLFLVGITTSDSGDLYISSHSYTGAPNRTLPLEQIVVYRRPNGVFLSAPLNSNIDPTSVGGPSWRFITSTDEAAARCDFNPCFSAGDYMRPAMNTVTGATLPFIARLSINNQPALFQSFVQDPPTGLPPVQGLQISPVRPFGADTRFQGVIPPDMVRQPDRLPSVLFLLGGPRQ